MQKLKRNYTSIHFYTRPRTRGCKILVLPKYGNQKDLKFSRIWRALGPEKHYICKALIAWLRPCNIPPSPPPCPSPFPTQNKNAPRTRIKRSLLIMPNHLSKWLDQFLEDHSFDQTSPTKNLTSGVPGLLLLNFLECQLITLFWVPQSAKPFSLRPLEIGDCGFSRGCNLWTRTTAVTSKSLPVKKVTLYIQSQRIRSFSYQRSHNLRTPTIIWGFKIFNKRSCKQAKCERTFRLLWGEASDLR